MINHKYKVIFIHIPKCAGSSIERFFEPVPQKFNVANRQLLYGWDEVLRMHLQHAPAKNLLKKKLVDKNTWKSYFKFAVVRNPWERAMSDYFWMMKDRKVNGSFKDYLLKRGEFQKYTSMPISKDYRGDHLLNQHEFVCDSQGKPMVDFIGRFENLDRDFEKICERIGVDYSVLPHLKKNKKQRPHYTDFYSPYQKKLVSQLYWKDIELFNYHF